MRWLIGSFLAVSQGVDIVINARKGAELIHPESNTYLELDIFIPSLGLAFEYQVLLPHIPLPQPQ